MLVAFRTVPSCLLADVIYMTCFSIMSSVRAAFISEVLNKDTDKSVLVYGFSMGLSMFCQFLALPALGSLADRFGRRKLLLVATAGMTIDCCLTLLVFDQSTIFFLFIGRAIQGLTGCFMTVSQAYMADKATTENGVLFQGANVFMQMVGMIIGAIAGGIMADIMPIRIPILVAAVCGGVSFFWILFGVRESLLKANRKPFSFKKANPVSNVILLFSVGYMRAFVSIVFVVAFAMSAFNSVLYFYMVDRYDANTLTFAAAMLTFALVATITAVISSVVAVKYGERSMIHAGLLCGCVGCIVMGISPWLALFFVGIFIVSCIMFAQPAYLSMISKSVSPQMQAEIQGGVFGFALICQMAGIFGMSAVYSSTHRSVGPGLVFFISAGMLFVAEIMAIVMFRIYKKEEIRIGTDMPGSLEAPLTPKKEDPKTNSSL